MSEEKELCVCGHSRVNHDYGQIWFCCFMDCDCDSFREATEEKMSEEKQDNVKLRLRVVDWDGESISISVSGWSPTPKIAIELSYNIPDDDTLFLAEYKQRITEWVESLNASLEPPLPRIEYIDGSYNYILYPRVGGTKTFTADEMNDLTTLNKGNFFPIYEPKDNLSYVGEWKRLYPREFRATTPDPEQMIEASSLCAELLELQEQEADGLEVWEFTLREVKG